MTGPLRIAVAGAGLIGRRHSAAIAATPGVELHCIIDPSDAGRDHADRIGVPWHGSLTKALEKGRPDGIVLATPNQVHVENALECVSAGVPALIEKPLATDLQAGLDLVNAGERAGVALLVGTPSPPQSADCSGQEADQRRLAGNAGGGARDVLADEAGGLF
jgi:predicted dehydrogenase